MRKPFFIREIVEEDKFVISRLRRQQLGPTLPHIQDVTSFNWGPSDRVARNFGLFFENELLSSLRLEILHDAEICRIRLDSPNLELPASLPMAITSRGVTATEWQGRGFHSVLKMMALMEAKMSQVEYCLAVTRSDSFRVPSFYHMGYEKVGSIPEVAIEGRPELLVMRLDMVRRSEQALSYIRKKHQFLLSEIEWAPYLIEKFDWAGML